jgi:hypothetical protein
VYDHACLQNPGDEDDVLRVMDDNGTILEMRGRTKIINSTIKNEILKSVTRVTLFRNDHK